ALQSQPEQPNKQIVIQTQKVEPNQISVRIQDNGGGISSQAISQIFEPFFTTKDVGKGTGLGLSICSQIIQKHQGQIKVNSKLGEGTEFVITLPIHPELAIAS
ncbi:MAG TPA: histidine kinase, partial [Cyanobacteria bacterium UBA12227]|nr:histidine kinase [Cyanobacteria bacterium UBA12227]